MQTLNSNLNILEEVAEELAFDPAVDATKIAVAARDGVVTLSGSVTSFAEKDAAEKAAKRVRGVCGVASEIRVDLAAFHQRSDAEIAAAILHVLAWSAKIPRDAVKVTVQEGWATLEGTLEWQYQKEHAESLVRPLHGVRGITNRINVKPHVQVAEVREKLRKAFERRADIDAAQLSIEAHGGKVQIRGKVRSWAEYSAISSAAYSIPGVTTVENLTMVAY